MSEIRFKALLLVVRTLIKSPINRQYLDLMLNRFWNELIKILEKAIWENNTFKNLQLWILRYSLKNIKDEDSTKIVWERKDWLAWRRDNEEVN